MTTARSIWVSFKEAGFHLWLNAPAPRAYLASYHRHLFEVRVAMPAHGDNREVEFHDLLSDARRHWTTGDGTMSCEQMAERLAGALSSAYKRSVAVEVSEDGECGAIVEVEFVVRD